MPHHRGPGLPAAGLPLTAAQRGIAAACFVDPSSSDYVAGDILRISAAGGTAREADGTCSGASGQTAAAIDYGQLHAACERVLHETPWLSLHLHGDAATGTLQPGRPAAVMRHPHDTLPGSDESQRWAAALRLARTDVTAPLDPSRDRLTTVRVFALSDTEAAVSLAVHHLLLDGYGVHLVLRRILRTYLHLTGQAAAPRPWADPRLPQRSRPMSAQRPPQPTARTGLLVRRVPGQPIPSACRAQPAHTRPTLPAAAHPSRSAAGPMSISTHSPTPTAAHPSISCWPHRPLCSPAGPAAATSSSVFRS